MVASTGTLSQSVPVTPSKKRTSCAKDAHQFDQLFLNFSNKYNLNLSRPEIDLQTLSPHKAKVRERSDPNLRIYRRLWVHWQTDNLENVFGHFETASLEILSRRHHGRGSETQRQELLDCLVNTLEALRPNNVSLDVTFPGSSRPTFTGSKRASDGSHPQSKRHQDVTPERPNLRSGLGHQSLRQSFYGLPAVGVNTSKSTLVSEIFDSPSAVAPSCSQDSATTVEAPSQEKERYPPPSLDSFGPSSNTQLALDISFGQYMDGQRPGDTKPPKSKGSTESTILARSEVEKRLQDVWPTMPHDLDDAPFTIRWEIQRFALACGVQVEDLRLGEYDPSWRKQDSLWKRLGKGVAMLDNPYTTMPIQSSSEAWNAAIAKMPTPDITEAVIFSASLTMTTGKYEPLFRVQLHPLKVDLPHRLDRRFGSDRFLQVTMPAVANSGAFEIAKWLVSGCHFLAGRKWAPFYVESDQQKKKRDVLSEPKPYSAGQLRIYFFAEDANEFAMHTRRWSESESSRCRMERTELLQWLLQVSKNKDQSALKLFQRIKLGLSRTYPTVILDPRQIRLPERDVLSPEGKVMNDGIGRMSRQLVRNIATAMGLAEQPCGFQGRLGSAKGFWIMDDNDTSDEIWIEIYPSQRKWNLNFSTAEKHHRTFEVRNYVRDLVPARLNLQLLPILEDRAIDSTAMRTSIGDFLRQTLQAELAEQKIAMQDPIQFLTWMHDAGRRRERVHDEQVSFLGGLPRHQGEQISLLLNSGFDPLESPFLRDIAWKIRYNECREVQSRLNIKIPRSTFAYMIVDFDGILAENEVHLGFASKFNDDFPETFLHGFDVLVARTPAHFPSDIQRVRAVFKPELRHLRNAVVFSTLGSSSLADKLSGGDYDGDQAWVCWEPTIVNNFRNAEVPKPPDLFRSGVLTKDQEKYRDLAKEAGVSITDRKATTVFLMKAFSFNMQPNYLGTFTNYKEALCYARNSVRDEKAILMSTVLSNLVDRPKQGVIFTEETFSKLKKICHGTGRKLDKPKYKFDCWNGGEIIHIIDYVKFAVGIPTVERELTAFDTFLRSKNEGVHYDLDLVREYEHRAPSRFYKEIIVDLKTELERLFQSWKEEMLSDKVPWEAKVTSLHDEYRTILPKPSSETDPEVVRLLLQEELRDSGMTDWDLLKASTLFKQYYKHLSFVFWMAGAQLAALKAKYSAKRGAPSVSVTARMYAGLRPDTKYAKALAAKHEGRTTGGWKQQGDETEDDDDDDDVE